MICKQLLHELYKFNEQEPSMPVELFDKIGNAAYMDVQEFEDGEENDKVIYEWDEPGTYQSNYDNFIVCTLERYKEILDEWIIEWKNSVFDDRVDLLFDSNEFKEWCLQDCSYTHQIRQGEDMIATCEEVEVDGIKYVAFTTEWVR